MVMEELGIGKPGALLRRVSSVGSNPRTPANFLIDKHHD
jgi:hypothetical protein